MLMLKKALTICADGYAQLAITQRINSKKINFLYRDLNKTVR